MPEQLERASAAPHPDSPPDPRRTPRRSHHRGLPQTAAPPSSACTLPLKGSLPRLPDAADRNAALGVSRWSALSARRCSRYSARRGEHPVGLGHPPRHQIVDHHPEIGLVPAEHHGSRPKARASRRSGRRPDLAPAASSYPVVPLIWPARNSPGNASTSNVGRATPDRHSHTRWHSQAELSLPFQGLGSTDIGLLHVRRQRGRKAVGIDHRVIEPLGLQETPGARPFPQTEPPCLRSTGSTAAPTPCDPRPHRAPSARGSPE